MPHTGNLNKTDLKFCTLNVGGLRKKLDDTDFLQFLNDFDIVSLQETFMLNNDLLQDSFTDFMPPFFSPATKLSSQGRCSGGVIVLVKQNLKNYVSELQNKLPNCITLKFKNIFTNELTCIFPYVPCASSPYYNNLEIKNGIILLDNYLHDIYNENMNSSFIILGDLNSRMSNVQPICDCDIASKYIDDVNDTAFFSSDNTAYFRKSEDLIINTFGKSLIEMCSTFNLIVMNGFCKGDTKGEFTFISPNGNSVIDYCLVSDDLLSYDSCLNVISRIESWHMPVSFEIKLPKCSNLPISPLTPGVKTLEKIKWNVNKIETFNDDWVRNDSKNNIFFIKEIMTKNTYLIDDCINAFTELLVNSAHVMTQCVTLDPNKPKFTKSWFDKECRTQKRFARKTLRQYQRTRLPGDRITYINQRKEYKRIQKIKQRNYYASKTNFLVSNINNSKTFWKEVRNICYKKQSNCDIDIKTWYTHFSNLFLGSIISPPLCSDPMPAPILINPSSLEELNSPFSETEISLAISNSKSAKSPGPDKLPNELLKHTQSDCLAFIHHALNTIFELHLFPSEWAKSIIVPVHKKGNINLCDNYRPISLTSLFSKVFTRVLDKRLEDFLNSNDIIPEEQAGFRKNYSTIDHIFSLYAMINMQFSKNKKLYVCFVDYRKAFDSVNREALFRVLERNGITGNFLLAVKSIYKKVLAAVRHNGEISDYFDCPTGLKQGCLLSPKLFSIFMTEISSALNEEGIDGIQLSSDFNNIFHLLFADDILLVSHSIQGLQNQINILRLQSQKLGLNINTTKTQIVVFRKGGRLAKLEKWFYGNTELKIVNSYKYLGLDFTTRLSFNNATRPFIAKAKQSCYEINKSLNSLNCYSLDVFTKLFDSKVLPVLSYASEVWGMSDVSKIEGVHTTRIKRFLNVPVHCSNLTLYSETGRFPLSIILKIKSLKYWFRLLKLDNTRISKRAYEMLLLASEQGSENWVSQIKRLLEVNGFGIVWLSKGVGNEKVFIKEMKLRLKDCFRQNWNDKMNNSENFRTFYSFKSFITPELFLNDISFGRQLRNILIKFRLGVSKINCHRYKFHSNKTLLRCPFCSCKNENEYHVLYECSVYSDIRCMLSSNLNVTPMNVLLSESMNHACVARYLLLMFKRREELIENAS